MRLKSLLLLTIFSTKALFSTTLNFPLVQSHEDIVALFPKSAEEMVTMKEETLTTCREALSTLKEKHGQAPTFENLVYPFDMIQGYLTMQACRAEAVSLVSPDTNLRQESLTTQLAFSNFMTELYANEHDLFLAIQACYEVNKNTMAPDEKYLTEQILWSFTTSGHNLPEEKRAQIAQLNNEISELSQQFAKNIQEDSSHFFVSREELEGVNDQVVNSFPTNESGEYRLGCDYPTYFSVMQTCNNGNTRKEFLKLFSNRAYPNNQEVLAKLIEKRDEEARLLGYKSHAHLSLANEMVHSPAAASTFLEGLWEKSKAKEAREFAQITQNLPSGITLTENNKLQAWDSTFATTHYKKTFYNIDNELVAEYFPLDSTFTGLMSIYEAFFDITIQEEPITGLWDENVRLLKVSEKDGTLVGYVLLDLYPRDNKYSHACDVPGIAPGLILGDKTAPSVDLVVANFTKPTKDKPSLLKHREVTTFFHEFGHALHDLFSKHRLASFSGISSSYIKIDFVELPSQMLEEWMWSEEILSKISSHYQTGEPMPSDMIKRLVESKNCVSGSFVQGQCYLSLLALNYFAEGSEKDISQIAKGLYERTRPNYQPLEEDNFQLSFGHLTGYGARYYGYLWSKVFALDVFEQIKAEGLLNKEVGKRYRRAILEKGASVDPNVLLKNFLGREPNQEAFIKDLGL